MTPRAFVRAVVSLGPYDFHYAENGDGKKGMNKMRCTLVSDYVNTKLQKGYLNMKSECFACFCVNHHLTYMEACFLHRMKNKKR